jgi:hypothetical protein
VLLKGYKSNLEIATIGLHKLEDFDFEVGFRRCWFNFKIAGQPTVVVQGNGIEFTVELFLLKHGKGDQVTISEIKTKLVRRVVIYYLETAVIFELQ